MRFLLGIFSGVLLLFAVAAAVVFTGSFNTSATVPPSRLEKRIAEFALDKSVARRAPDRKNPLPTTPETLGAGLIEYREACLVCHGAPGVDPGEIGMGLNPGAPDLTVPRVQARSDGQLFWITSEGIRLTGMPAFSPTHDENEIWQIVAFVRHLPELTDEEAAELKRATVLEEHAETEGAKETPRPSTTATVTPAPTP
jgi:mono/diheme cytochrome c family protein